MPTNTNQPDTQNIASKPVVFILDCDNTLLDNDALKADMDRQLRALLGDAGVVRFWEVYEATRKERDVVDLPHTFAHLREEHAFDDTTLAHAERIVMDYPFATRLYPATLVVLQRLHTLGRPVIVSDGEEVYQPRKIEQSGLAAAVDGQVAIYQHKEDHLDEIEARWPASYYVMIDDKARILAETKRRQSDLFVTIHLAQGHYAGEAASPAPDVSLAGVGDLLTFDFAGLPRFLKKP